MTKKNIETKTNHKKVGAVTKVAKTFGLVTAHIKIRSVDNKLISLKTVQSVIILIR